MVEEIRQKAAEYSGLSSDPYFLAVVQEIGKIRREDFVPSQQRRNAYRGVPLPIGFEQTISDPYIVAVMIAASRVQSQTNVLEVGTGSGYQAAVLSKLGARVHTLEIVAPLAVAAARRLRRLGIRNVSVKAGDGFAGWPEFGLYGAIIVTAGAAEIPPVLLAELEVGGRLIMPIGPQGPLEQLVLVTKRENGNFVRCSLGPTMFVPLTGLGERPASMKGIYDRSLAPCF